VQLWILLSLLALAANAAKVLIVKLFCRGIDSRLLVFSGRLVSTLVLLPVLMISYRGLPSDGLFWAVIAVTAILTAVASVLYTQALQQGVLAIVLPTQAAVPVLSLVTLWIGWSETPSPRSAVLMTVSMICLAYALSAQAPRSERNPDGRRYVVYALIAAVLFGVTTILDRVAIARVAFGALAYSACWNLASTVLMGVQCRQAGLFRSATLLRTNIGPILLYSGAVLAAFYTQQYAVQLSLSIPGGVVHVKSIVMLHLPVVMLAGYLWLKEKISPRSLIAGLLALAAGWMLIRDIAR
jgi:drug/metabolite transporter (DMT)-like permease